MAASYRRRLLGGRTLAPTLHSESSEQVKVPADVATKAPLRAAPQTPPKVRMIQRAEAVEPVAVLDRLAYIATLAEGGSLAIDALHQMFDFVTAPGVRLCLRACGSMPKVLQIARKARASAENDEKSSIAEQEERVACCRLLHAGILQCLAVDSTFHDGFFTLATEDILAMIKTGGQPLPVSSTLQSTTNQCAGVAGERSMLKRRRKESDGVGSLSSAIKLVETHLQTRHESFFMAPIPPAQLARDVRLLALLAMQTCLNRVAGASSHAQFTQERHSNISTILQHVVMLLAEKPFSQPHTAVGQLCAKSESHGNILVLLLDIVEICISAGAVLQIDSLVGTTSPCVCKNLLQFCWSLLSFLLEEDPLKRKSKPSCSILPNIVNASLRMLYALSRKSMEWAQFMISPLAEAQITIERETQPRRHAPSILAVLVEVLGFSGPEGIARTWIGARTRLAMGILANIASHSSELRQAVMQFPVASDYVARFLKNSLGSEVGVHYAISKGSCDNQLRFLQAMSIAFAAHRKELFGVSGSPSAEIIGSRAEACTTCAVVAMLLGWLMHEEPTAHASVIEFTGQTEELVDMLRQFLVFQDHFGTLTDDSLLDLHSVMTSVQAHTALIEGRHNVLALGTQAHG